MTSIPEIISEMQAEYPNLNLFDEDILQGEPAITIDTHDYILGAYIEEDILAIYFEDYNSDYTYTGLSDIVIDDLLPSDIYQYVSNFCSWLIKNKAVDPNTKEEINNFIIKPLKKQGHKPEIDFIPED